MPKILKKVLPSKFTDLQNKLLVGSLLGDGCLYRRKKTHKAYYTVRRSLKDESYLFWETDVWSEWVVRRSSGETFDRRTGKIYKFVKFSTHRHSLFDDFYDLWYPNGIKRIPEELNLSPEAIAAWFCDDGYADTTCSPWRLRIKLATNGFEKDEVERLCGVLSSRYGEYFGVSISDETPVIYGADSASRALLNEIDCHIPVSMERKAIWRKPECRFYENIPERSADDPKKRKTVLAGDCHDHTSAISKDMASAVF